MLDMGTRLENLGLKWDSIRLATGLLLYLSCTGSGHWNPEPAMLDMGKKLENLGLKWDSIRLATGLLLYLSCTSSGHWNPEPEEHDYSFSMFWEMWEIHLFCGVQYNCKRNMQIKISDESLEKTVNTAGDFRIITSSQQRCNKMVTIIFIFSLRIVSCLACVYRVTDARGEFGEYERSVRVARGAAESNPSFLSALQTCQV